MKLVKIIARYCLSRRESCGGEFRTIRSGPSRRDLGAIYGGAQRASLGKSQGDFVRFASAKRTKIYFRVRDFSLRG